MVERPSLIIFPGWRDNPYPAIMSLAAAGAGFDVLSVTRLDSVVEYLHQGSRGDVLHMHWTAPVCQRAETEAHATRNLERFRKALRSFRLRGGRIAWTIHNAVPHELHYPQHELELMRLLARVADRIHVMSPATAEVLAPEVVLPAEKVIRVPHPSYVGIYPQASERLAARASLGVAQDSRVVLFLGQLRPYKGVGTLLAALRAVPNDEASAMTLLLAGKVRKEDRHALEAALPTHMHVVFRPGFVPDQELGMWYAAADLTVLPYEQILNSGSAFLAATYGVPVVLPGEESLLQEFHGQPWVHYFDPSNAVADIASLLREDSTYERHATELDEFLKARSPWRISQRFANEVLAGWLPRER